jgi:glycerophosphoryl diester phosphodiesterase
MERYTVHIFSFVSQYQWITNDKVIVKQFDFNNLKELEDYMSNKFNVDFKLIYKNKTNLDYCAVTRTPELVEFVDRYIDGVVKRSKSII